MEYEDFLGFSPDGRLIQVEYAQQASEQGSLVVFSSDEKEICVSIEVKTHNNMFIEQDKLFRIDPDQDIWMSYSGLKPDSYKVISNARAICRNYKITTGEDISIETLAYELSKYKQRFTLDSDMRPLGIRTVLFYIGNETKIYVVEPDGNFSQYTSYAIGQKSTKVCDYLEKCESNDFVYQSISGLGTIVQSDKNKVISYILGKDKCTIIDENKVQEIIKEVSV